MVLGLHILARFALDKSFLKDFVFFPGSKEQVLEEQGSSWSNNFVSHLSCCSSPQMFDTLVLCLYKYEKLFRYLS